MNMCKLKSKTYEKKLQILEYVNINIVINSF